MNYSAKNLISLLEQNGYLMEAIIYFIIQYLVKR